MRGTIEYLLGEYPEFEIQEIAGYEVFTGALILLSLIGCALSFVMLDYTRDVVRLLRPM